MRCRLSIAPGFGLERSCACEKTVHLISIVTPPEQKTVFTNREYGL